MAKRLSAAQRRAKLMIEQLGALYYLVLHAREVAQEVRRASDLYRESLQTLMGKTEERG